ncbi:DUF3810 domain-containing protein [Sunxiuqinia indica]|uniref:DUF3810 domain-containing protein n=1 Tax=Sunxiuqinia indica TaxID=2692584 RepID=UPI0013581AE7|nr:DUF3810 domain-containing protein [Sunxiuqinia indica]
MRTKIFSKSLLGIWLAVATFLLTELAAAFPAMTEAFYSQQIYPVVATILSAVSRQVPFSLDDLFYVGLIFFAVVTVVALVIRKIKWRKFLLLWFNSLAILYMLFYWLWGFNYYREDLNQRLSISESEPGTELFLTVFEKLVERTNESYVKIDSLRKSQVDLWIENSYQHLAPFLQIEYPSGVRRSKSITFSRFFAAATISGYYGPFFNEVHVNSYLLPIEYPLVLAHEKAHQFGITGEAEANFYAWLVCSQSQEKQLRYSANLYVLRYFIYEAYKLEGYTEIIEKLDERVKSDLRRIREHWLQLRDEKIDDYASKVNDAYLKTNKIEKGIDDYTGVVKFVMDFETDSLSQKRVIGLQGQSQ